ncbi:MAG: histidine--tRNA ligase [Clostridia bacterium]
MARVKPALLRGFEEYLPQEQLAFNAWVDAIRATFERFGFLPIETPSAERVEALTSKGVAEKEIYALTRLAAAEGEDDSTKGALRFDLTVPLARYVALHEHELAFPFRRYQIQRVWRGETPQVNKGRYREFYQCDIDIINKGELSILAEAEIPSIIHGVFSALDIGRFEIRINNRKVLKGLLQHFDVPEARAVDVLRILDKVDKLGPDLVKKELTEAALGKAVADELYGVVSAKQSTGETLAALDALKNRSELLNQGIAELRDVMAAVRAFGVPEAGCRVDLSVIRGLDYYTGTIYETSLLEHPELGSVCSGGRYDDLASYFSNTKMPGVGISIGLTRLFSAFKGLRAAGRTPAQVLVTTMDPARLDRYLEIGRRLREAGINTEIYLEGGKFRKQMEYANKKGFQVAVIAGEDELAAGEVQVKNLASQASSRHPLAGVVPAVEAVLKTFSKGS